MKTGIELIADERKRQIEEEGWTSKHDTQYEGGQLVGAAMCYASNSVNKRYDKEVLRAQLFFEKRETWSDAWPWDADWDKRETHDPLRSLVIAGALISAEIDRLQRQKL